MALSVDRINGISGDLAIKAPCRVATTAAITLAGFQTIDGVTPVEADTNLRVLVKNQTDTTQNGIYDMSSSTWQRSTDFNGASDVVKGTEVTVQEGAVSAGFFFVVASADPIAIGTSAITFTSSATAATSAAAAAASAVTAQTAETNAAASAVAAQTAETNAETAETNAETAETNAAASAAAAAASAATIALPLAVASGGTGSTTVSAARTALGVAIGTDVQGFDADIPTVSASQAEMEAGAETALRSMSPLRIAQAIAALSSGALTKGGRLTLSSGVPAAVADVSASTSIYYSPYIHNKIPLYNGSAFVATTFSELTNTTTDATKNPAAVANNSNYDLFVWSDAGTVRLGRGPAWTSDSARGAGAGTTGIVRVNGIWLNANAITNGPAAQRGTYVGTVRSNGTASIDWIATPAVDTPARLCVFNESNRVLATAQARDSTNTWTYNSATIRSARGVDNVRINAIFGLTEEPVLVQYNGIMSGGASGDATVGIGVNATNAYTGLSPYFSIGTNLGSGVATYRGIPPNGFVFFQACEAQLTTASAATYVGDVGNAGLIQSGLIFMGNM